jgi:hypothetical protein
MRNKVTLNRTMEVDMSLLKNRKSPAPAIRAKEGLKAVPRGEDVTAASRAGE